MKTEDYQRLEGWVDDMKDEVSNAIGVTAALYAHEPMSCEGRVNLKKLQHYLGDISFLMDVLCEHMHRWETK